ncbi:MAG: hypothetical protein OK436_06850, partial [Thaumarchaeota archaeon]|nr:hypothetical protein [Nitrososphaerota archaeon]
MIATVAQMTGMPISDIQSMIDYYNRTNGASLNLDQLVNQYLKTSIDAAVFRILDFQYQQTTGHSMDNALMGQIRSAVLAASPQVQQDLQAQLLGSLKLGYTMTYGGASSLTSIVGNLGFLAPILANTPIAGAVVAPS